MSRYLSPLLALCALTGLTLTSAAPALAQSSLVLGGTAYSEEGELTGEQQISVQERDESFAYENADFLSARILYLRPFKEHFRIGGGIDFIGNYRANVLDEDGQPEDPIEVYEFGPLLEVMAHAEWNIGITERIDLGLGAQVGLVGLFPRGDLRAEIRELQDQDVNTFMLPRLGWSAAPQVLATYRFDERLALRADVGVQWQSIWIFNTEQNVNDVAFRKKWTAGTMRTRVGLALEVRL
ncbi:hypothetical protein DL240_08130 [Lujinxingia litoralis]|uniref:Outer membrane protein beta-barrel domain-containing protein n=2 Tax=Lujinxingia litoralis TaxID=2211119 RepID=A0A328C850_9DELT|nr:hypothetical protein DL240_08130 [Lujinxingia litoralis]